MQNLILINGNRYPLPKRGVAFTVESNISTVRNANGETVGQKAGRHRNNIESLEWEFLDADTWQGILSEFATGLDVPVTLPDMMTGTWITRLVIFEKCSAQPWRLSKETGFPLDYRNCIITLTDTGVNG